MIELQNLLMEDETVGAFHLHNEYITRNLIILKNGCSDISGALEETLHRILDNGGTEDDVYRIMGAKIPMDEELSELDEFKEYINIDLGYILPGLIDYLG